ncbi:hypothetical protein [Granulicella sp. dw_53]|uniref:hypothetical protein n=1 Tax=Granulicella sp. dw_53 TaxID=2719792 RepID=UPI0021043DF4|nr:hypothetical protein [Granulicella sp. dw_53]
MQIEELPSREEWQLALRIVASKGLCKSDLLQKFFLYVCEQQLMGNSHGITEQRIGTLIFNRAADYNPGEDNIVRSYARLLRKRLDEYFQGEGLGEPIRVIIPRGGYAPVFHRAPDAHRKDSNSGLFSNTLVEKVVSEIHSNKTGYTPKSAASVDLAVSAPRWRSAWLLITVGLIAGVLFTSATWAGIRTLQKAKTQGPAHPIWAELFQKGQNTLIVPADSGLGILQNLTKHLVTLEEYANETYPTEMKSSAGLQLENLNDLRHQRYTSVVSLDITVMLTQLPEFAANRSQIRYARNVTIEDLKSSNVILMGSTHTNPWVSLFEKDLNFKLEYMSEVDQSFVLNERPVGTEQKRYLNGTAETSNRTYGAIDYLPGLEGNGHVLIIQGLNMAATQAAADTLFDPQEMSSILKQAVRSDGSLKSFELLIETSSIGASDPGAQIIATRFYP